MIIKNVDGLINMFQEKINNELKIFTYEECRDVISKYSKRIIELEQSKVGD